MFHHHRRRGRAGLAGAWGTAMAGVAVAAAASLGVAGLGVVGYVAGSLVRGRRPTAAGALGAAILGARIGVWATLAALGALLAWITLPALAGASPAVLGGFALGALLAVAYVAARR